MLRLAEVKDSLDIDVKQNFIDPLQTVADKDIKDIQVSRTVQDPRQETQKCRQENPKRFFSASSEEAGGPTPGLRLQEEASG